MVNKSLISRHKKSLIKINITELARTIGKTRTWVSLVLHGHKKSTTTRKAIASALGVRVEELWPNNHPERALRNGASKKAA